jgi:uncharacterized protein
VKSCLFTGQLTHHRVRPARHAFRYSTAYFWLDLDEIESLGRRLLLFGVNRRGVFSFYDADHLDGLGGSTRERIKDCLGARGIDLRGGAVFLLTQCRLLGYVFNPVSFYYAYEATGVLRAIVAEVNNTFGERHLYVLADTEREPSEDRETTVFTAVKRFHVSPFLSTNAHYEFRFAPVGERLSVFIRECEGSMAMLDAHLWGKRRPLDDRALAALALRHPLSTLKVTAAIHWQALRLWRKGLPFYSHPGPVPCSPSQEVRR